METLTLNDGTQIRGHYIETETRLFLYCFEITLAESVQLLNDPEKTKVIRMERYGETSEVRGYKHLYSVSEDRLKKLLNSMMEKEKQRKM